MRTAHETIGTSFLLVLLALLVLGSCAQRNEPDGSNEQPRPRIGSDEAIELIRGHLSTQGGVAADRISVIEMTTDEVFEFLTMQVFLETNEGTSYVIKNGVVVQLCEGYGGNGLQSMYVADLDDDQDNELVFTYSWGSGVHRSHVGVCFEDSGAIHVVTAPVWYYGDLFLRREDCRRVVVIIGEYLPSLGDHKARMNRCTHIADFGEVRFSHKDEIGECDVKIYEALPDTFREEIDRNER